MHDNDGMVAGFATDKGKQCHDFDFYICLVIFNFRCYSLQLIFFVASSQSACSPCM